MTTAYMYLHLYIYMTYRYLFTVKDYFDVLLFIFFFKLTAFRFNLSYPRLLSYTVGYLVYNRNFSGLSGKLGKTLRMYYLGVHDDPPFFKT